jgi:hypothetical protein
MSSTKTRKKNSRFYWAELGFLVLGLVGLNPSLLTDLLVGNSVPAPQNFSAQPLYGHPTSSPTQSQYGAYPPTTYAPSGGYGSHQAYPPSAQFHQTGYGATPPTTSMFSQQDIPLLASQVSEYLSSATAPWWNSPPGTQGSQNVRPSTAGLAPTYSNTYPASQTNGQSGSIPSYPGEGQFGAPNSYGSTWQNPLPPIGTAATVPPPNYNTQGMIPFPSTAGATYSAQLPSGASVYANPAGFSNQAPQPANLVRGYSSNYQTLANPGSFMPAGSTANVMQQRQTQAGYANTSTGAPNGWTTPYPSASTFPAPPTPASGTPSRFEPAGTGYYGRY